MEDAGHPSVGLLSILRFWAPVVCCIDCWNSASSGGFRYCRDTGHPVGGVQRLFSDSQLVKDQRPGVEAKLCTTLIDRRMFRYRKVFRPDMVQSSAGLKGFDRTLFQGLLQTQEKHSYSIRFLTESARNSPKTRLVGASTLIYPPIYLLLRKNTDFYILTDFPIEARPFYTMPSPTDPRYTNSFDVFIRGEWPCGRCCESAALSLVLGAYLDRRSCHSILDQPGKGDLMWIQERMLLAISQETSVPRDWLICSSERRFIVNHKKSAISHFNKFDCDNYGHRIAGLG